MTLETQLAAFRSTYRLQRIMIDGIEWSYFDTTVGAQTLLLLPGGPGVAEMAFRYIQAFAPHFRVIAPGYPASVGSLPELLAGIDAVLSHASVEQFHLVGASYSGMTAQYVLARYPKRIRSLLIGDTGVPRRERAAVLQWLAPRIAAMPRLAIHALLAATLQALLGGATPERRFWRRYLRSALIAATPQELANRMQIMAEMDAGSPSFTTNLLQHIPVLLIESTDDQLFSPQERAALREYFASAEYHAFSGHRHTTALTNSSLYIELMLNFLLRQIL